MVHWNHEFVSAIVRQSNWWCYKSFSNFCETLFVLSTVFLCSYGNAISHLNKYWGSLFQLVFECHFGHKCRDRVHKKWNKKFWISFRTCRVFVCSQSLIMCMLTKNRTIQILWKDIKFSKHWEYFLHTWYHAQLRLSPSKINHPLIL